MTEVELRDAFTSQLGIMMPDDQNAEADRLAALVTDNICAANGIDPTDKWARAAYAYELQQKGDFGKGAETKVVVAGSTAPAEVSAATKTALMQTINNRHGDLMATSQSASIEHLIVQKPDMTTYVQANSKFIVDPEKAKTFMEKHADESLIDPETLADYHEVMRRLKAGEAFEVNYAKKSTKPIGLAVSVAGDTKIMDKQELDIFVALKTSGFILGGNGKAGAKMVVVKSGAKTKGGITVPAQEKQVIKLTGTKEAAESAIIAMTASPTETVNNIAVKSVLSFKERAKDKEGNLKTNKNGDPVYRKVTVSGSVAGAKLVWNPEYEAKFNTRKGANNDCVPSETEMKKIMEAQATYIAQLIQKSKTDPSLAVLVGDDFAPFKQAIAESNNTGNDAY